jgi:hypothetical protein
VVLPSDEIHLKHRPKSAGGLYVTFAASGLVLFEDSGEDE